MGPQVTSLAPQHQISRLRLRLIPHPPALHRLLDAPADSRPSPDGTSNTLGHQKKTSSLPEPQEEGLVALDLLLELEQAVQERLRSGRTARYVDIYGDDPVAAPDNLFTGRQRRVGRRVRE